MTVSIRKMSLGTGYEYLLESVTRGDGAVPASSPMTRYYTESGTPPGYWLGSGLVGLDDGAGLQEGAEVTEDQLFRLLGMLQDPITGESLGRRPANWPTPLGERIRLRTAAMPEDLTVGERAERVREIETEERERDKHLSRPVAGFDLTFSVPKSVSTVWAITDATTQEVIHQAHRDAIQTVLSYAEKNILLTRTGAGGAMQVPIHGVIAAAFDHWESRSGDPHLHTHVVIANRVQGPDGEWRSLDARVLFAYVVALSEMHEGVVQDLLSSRLGYAWTERARKHSAVPRWEVAGVPQALIEEFSSRSRDIEDAKNELVAEFADKHGRQPTSEEVLRLRQRATLQSRPDKEHYILAEQTEVWRERSRPFVGGDTAAASAELAWQNPLPAVTGRALDSDLMTEAARTALATVATKRATFTRANVLAEVHRQLHGVRFTTGQERLAVAESMASTALSETIVLTPDSPNTAAVRYTTPALMQAESRLLEAGHSVTGPVVETAQIEPDPAHPLGPDQRAAVAAITTSGRAVDLLVGPAGSGKTTALAALRESWEEHFGPGSVIGLAPSAAAADVLASELGIATENTAKWLHETARQDDRLDRIANLYDRSSAADSDAERQRLRAQARQIYREYEQWQIAPDQLVIIDEAGMAGTLDLDQIVRQAREGSGKVLLVGDWAQLGAIEAGGAFAMLVNDRPDVPELSTVRRFEHNWEKDASLQLRVGDPVAIDAYVQHDRVHAGDREHALDQLFRAWRTDTTNGLASVMIAADSDAVRELNLRARADRIASGDVHPGGVPIADGTVGVGDQVVTRQNDRRLNASGRWVRNGDQWTVDNVGRDGSLTVQLVGSDAKIDLPAEYVREHVELGYATTAHRAQGRTVDTAHALVDQRTSREMLYVAATRGRGANHLYVDLTPDTDPETGHGATVSNDGCEILAGVLRRTGAEQSAHILMAADRWSIETSLEVSWTDVARDRGLSFDGVDEPSLYSPRGELTAATPFTALSV